MRISLEPVGDYLMEDVLRGDTNADALTAIEHIPEGLLERLRVASEQSIRCNQLIIQEQRLLMDHLKAACARAPISRAESP